MTSVSEIPKKDTTTEKKKSNIDEGNSSTTKPSENRAPESSVFSSLKNNKKDSEDVSEKINTGFLVYFTNFIDSKFFFESRLD